MGDWIWGNSKGGCGAPLRDSEGNVITNLKTAVKSGVSNSPQGKPRRASNRCDEDEYHGTDQRDRFNGSRDPRQRDRRERDRDEEYDRPPRDRDRDRDERRRESDPYGSPSKGRGSALQEMNSSMSFNDRAEKQRKAAEYQDLLRQQIEEKNRKKEIEKRKEDEEKRRELEAYLSSIRPSPQQQQQGGPRKPLFKPDNDEDEDEDDRRRAPRNDRRGGGGRDEYDDNEDRRGNRGGGNGRGFQEPPRERVAPRDVRGRGGDDDDSTDGWNNKHKAKVPVNIPGLPPKRNDGRRSEPSMDEDDAPPRRAADRRDNFRDRDQGRYSDEEDRNGDNHRKPNRVVSAHEYDELSALCDKLLAQQEQLQSEIRTQASVIKDLQKAGGGKGGMPAPVLRSKSAVQTKRQDDFKPPRPGSMPQKQQPAGAAANKKGPAAAAEQRKAAKVAFGASVIAGDKRVPASNAPPKTQARGGGAAPAAAKGAPKVPPLGGNKGVPPRGAANGERNGGGGGGGGGLSGFAALQHQVSKKQGPVVVTYEDEGDYGGNNGLELRGQSRFIPVQDDGDEIDHLLNKARKGRFS